MKPSYLSLTDLFCGAGGASIGAELAGVKLVLGVNHWQRAVETHSQNFPHAAHDCRNISDTHPSRYGSTHLLWASPECTTLSQARGKKRNYTGQLPLDAEFEPLPTEAEEKSRVHPLDVVRFAEYHHYEAIVVENVVEECLWGLLPAWFRMMEDLGYAHRTLYLNSMFFGVPQSRDRVYFVFWRKGNKAPDLDFRPSSWCPACEAVVEGVQSFKPRCAPTRRYGPRQQYVYVCPQCTGQVLPFVTPALTAIDWGVLGERIGDRKDPLAPATMARIQAGIDRYWNRPVVLDTMRDPKHRDASTAPLPTQTGRQSQALYIPLIAHFRGTEAAQVASSARPADQPMGVVSAGGIHHGLIVRNYSGGPEMSKPAEEPLGSITAVDHHALLGRPALVDPMRPNGSGRPPDAPLPTLVAGEARGGHRPALIVGIERGYRGREHQHVRETSEVLSTLTTGHDRGLVVPAGGTWRRGATPADEPLPTRTGTETDAFVTAYYRNAVHRDASEPMPTFRAVESHGLVEAGETVRIEDCSFRMLMPAEIGRGMAFRDAYRVLGTQRERVRQYGQAVTPPVATWLLQRVVESLR